MAALARASAWAAQLWRMALNRGATFSIETRLDRDTLCIAAAEQRRAWRNEDDADSAEGRDDIAFPAKRP